MNKKEFVEILAKKLDLSKNKCESVLSEIKSTIVDALKKGEEVSLKNFGKFKIVERKSRKCINPITKKHYYSKPKKVTRFEGYGEFKYIFN